MMSKKCSLCGETGDHICAIILKRRVVELEKQIKHTEADLMIQAIEATKPARGKR